MTPQVSEVRAPRGEKSQHIPALDGIRAFAILIVMAFHYRDVFASIQNPAAHALIKILDFGWCGVDLFFVLSGFLITGILLDSKSKSLYFTRFYWRRMLRIFPPYYALLLFVFLPAGYLITKFDHVARLAPSSPWWYILYVSNWKPPVSGLPAATDQLVAHTWTLAIEEQFYLIWPLVVYLSCRRVLAGICGSLALAALAFRCIAIATGIGIQFYTPARMDDLVLGALMAIVFRDEAWSAFCKRISIPIIVSLVAAVSILIGVQQTALWYVPSGPQPFYTFGLSAYGLLFALVVFRGAAAAGGPLWTIVASPVLRSIGKYSYGMYLIHWPLHIFLRVPLNRILANQPESIAWMISTAYFLISFFLVYGLAFLSWRYFESKLLRFKDRLPFTPSEPRLQYSRT